MVHENGTAPAPSSVRTIPQAYTNDDSDASARRLILALRPEWDSPASHIEFVRFTDGITNTLLKAVNKLPGLSKDAVDADAVLLRAYGQGTDLIIDRARETQNHELLMRHGLAPELLARFDNGMLYRFVRGSVTQPEDLRSKDIYLAVARRLAQWHATMPCLPGKTHISEKLNEHSAELLGSVNSSDDGTKFASLQEAIDGIAPETQAPNVWTVMQKWIFALPTATPAQKERQALLQSELRKLVAAFSQRPGLGQDGTPGITPTSGRASTNVTFIDYEYAVPSPAAFDLANHFAEWGGFDCDYNVLPTRAQRRAFIAEYVRAYFTLAQQAPAGDLDAEFERLVAEVDAYRGLPGFYWGVWALIQATISEIDFDYASYAEVRLGEYWAWKAEVEGSRVGEMPLRERRWAEGGEA